jgi:hypothetical protein
MSKRNFILLIIILIVIIITFFGFLYFRQPTVPTIDDTGGTNFFSQFNPFGNGKINPPKTTPPVDVSNYQPNPTETQNLKLNKISSIPVAGFVVYQKERLSVPVPSLPSPSGEISPKKDGLNSTGNSGTGTTEFAPALRYVAKANGNIYQTFVDKIEERKFSETTIPQVYEAFFGNKGESVVMRYLKADGRTIETFVGTLPKELLGGDTTENNEIKGSFLPNNIKDISVSPDTANIFYLFTVGDNMVGTTLNLTTNLPAQAGKKVQIFTSPFTEWLSWWPNIKMITLTTKPSSLIPGYMYGMDANGLPAQTGKNLTQILGNINGLTTLTSPDGKLILYGNNNLSLSVYHTDTKVSELLGVKTLPEKCAWNNISDVVYCAVPKSIDGGAYPDTWYQGETSFNDIFWKIDIKNRNTTMLLDPTTVPGGEEVDGIKLALDENENYLFFVNKKDSFLWELNLK